MVDAVHNRDDYGVLVDAWAKGGQGFVQGKGFYADKNYILNANVGRAVCHGGMIGLFS
jgi:hypothetical protein